MDTPTCFLSGVFIYFPFAWTSLQASRAPSLSRALGQSTSTHASEDHQSPFLMGAIPGISETPPLTGSVNKNPDQRGETNSCGHHMRCSSASHDYRNQWTSFIFQKESKSPCWPTKCSTLRSPPLMTASLLVQILPPWLCF